MSLEDLQAQLRGTLDHQFAALKQKYEEGIAEARRQADAEAAAGREQARAEADARVRSVVEQARAAAERAVTDKVGQARADAEAQVRTATAEIRAAAERDVAAQVERVRAEFEQARAEWETQMHAAAAAARAEVEQAAAEAAQQERAALEQKLEQAVADAAQREREAHEQKLEAAVEQAVAAARRGAELELESERRRGQNQIDAEREKAKTELEVAREQLTAEVEAERLRAKTELEQVRESMQAAIAVARQAGAASVRPAAPEPAVPAVTSEVFDRLLSGVQEIDGATTLSQALGSLLKHSALTAGRAAIFLINGDRLKPWKSSHIPEVDVQTVESSIGGKDLLARAIQAGQALATGPALAAPPFARLPAGRPGLAVPLMINGRAVAVLYADSGTNPPPLGVAEIVEGLVRHTSAILALRTAMRSLELVGGVPANGESPTTGAGEDDDQGARRFARLLLSEIKLYNEGAVRVGREKRDIRRRLREEIDRAQRLYEERVPLEVSQRHAYFQQELVQTLADGDPALLGEQ